MAQTIFLCYREYGLYGLLYILLRKPVSKVPFSKPVGIYQVASYLQINIIFIDQTVLGQ